MGQAGNIQMYDFGDGGDDEWCGDVGADVRNHMRMRER